MERGREFNKEILLVPLGKVITDVLEEIAVAVRKTYRFHVRIGRSEEPDTNAYSDPRRQYDADKLLELMQGRKRESLVAALGVVDSDMFSGDKTFVFGVHSPGRGAGVLALSRLREEFYKKPPKRELFLRRAVTEAIHQVAMAVGLAPCTQKKCVAYPGASLWRLDEKEQALCPACQVKLDVLLASKRPAPPRLEPAAPAPAAAALEEEPEASPTGNEIEPQNEPQEINTEPGRDQNSGPYDESQMPADQVEPEIPPAEATAMHEVADGPEEPLDAASKSR